MKFSVRRVGLLIVGAAAMALISPLSAQANAEGIPLEQYTQVTQEVEGVPTSTPQTAEEIRRYYCHQTKSLSGGRQWRCH